jgi:hypothetical protein
MASEKSRNLAIININNTLAANSEFMRMENFKKIEIGDSARTINTIHQQFLPIIYT